MKIGLYYESISGWQGGRDLFAILFRSLQAGCAPVDQITIVTHQSRDRLFWRLAHIGKHVLTTVPWDRGWLARELVRTPKSKQFRQIYGSSARIEWVPRQRSQIDCDHLLSAFDVVGPLQVPPRSQSCKAWVGYITDCQHKRLPHNFSPEECARRDQVYSLNF